MFPRIRTHNESGNVYTGRFKVFGQSMVVTILFVWDTVIAYQWIRQNQYLTPIRWIGQSFGITYHAGIEDNFARGSRNRCPKRISAQGWTAIGQMQHRRITLQTRKGKRIGRQAMLREGGERGVDGAGNPGGLRDPDEPPRTASRQAQQPA